MKTAHSMESVRQFLATIANANPGTLKRLTEGHISQAFSYDSLTDAQFVLRIAPSDKDFVADQYAARTFGAALACARMWAAYINWRGTTNQERNMVRYYRVA